MFRQLLAISTIALVSCGQTAKPTCDMLPTVNNYGIADKYGYKPYYDLDSARQCARSTGRQILLLFTGYSSTATPGTEWEVLTDKEVKKIINDNYILTVLYVDDKTPLDNIDSTQKTSTGAVIQTMGQKNSSLEATLFQNNSQPYYICVDSDLHKIAEPFGYIRLKDKDEFIRQLTAGLNK